MATLSTTLRPIIAASSLILFMFIMRLHFNLELNVDTHQQHSEYTLVPNKCNNRNEILIGSRSGCHIYLYGTEMELSDILFINNDTKIVEIGLPKTGTTSLGRALQSLGYIHRGWNAKLWEYYKATHDLNHILRKAKRYNALQDAPWHSVHYLFWLKAYPNAKFIYQYRDEEAWLQSLESHFSPKYNVNNIGKYLDERWITDRSYIRSWWLEEHRQRFEDITDYFKDKPSKLLVTDITNGMDWKPLCDFLNKTVPSRPFPVSNKSNRKQNKTRL